MNTGIRQYFSPTTRLPSHKDTGIGAVATREANGAVKRVLEKQASQRSAKKLKRYTNFSDTDRAEIGRYAAEYENATAQLYYCYYARVLVKLEEGVYRSFAKIRSLKMAKPQRFLTRKT